MYLILLRLAQTDANREGRVSGRNYDSPLTEAGKEMAEDVGTALKELTLAQVYSSPMGRCRETAKFISNDIEIIDEFNEIDLGEFDGKTKQEIKTSLKGKIFFSSIERCVIPGVEETIFETLELIKLKIKELFQKHKNEKAILIVTHGGTMRAILCGILGDNFTNFWRLKIGNCAIIIIEMKSEDSFVLHDIINSAKISEINLK
ncbi:MAG: histidine phosphatase family protein [Candidatus Eremiobacteraeota bacterium]|nr:histidine phosphatase family protein [Candidatus Eremiobacteraeota bacterium]